MVLDYCIKSLVMFVIIIPFSLVYILYVLVYSIVCTCIIVFLKTVLIACFCFVSFCICRANIVSLKFNLQMVFANVPPKMCLTCRLCISVLLFLIHFHYPFPYSFSYIGNNY